MKELVLQKKVEDEAEKVADMFRQALSCTPEEFGKRYREFKEAKAKFDEVYEVFKENYTKLVKKYGKLKNEDSGVYEFDDVNRDKFNEEVEKLMDIECEIDTEKIEIGDDIRLSAAQVIALDDFISFKE